MFGNKVGKKRKPGLIIILKEIKDLQERIAPITTSQIQQAPLPPVASSRLKTYNTADMQAAFHLPPAASSGLESGLINTDALMNACPDLQDMLLNPPADPSGQPY